MPGINERMCIVETKQDAVLYSLDELKDTFKTSQAEMKKIWEDHIENCHKQVHGCGNRLNEMDAEIRENTRFKDLVIKIMWWVVPSGPLVVLALIWGFKKLFEKGMV